MTFRFRYAIPDVLPNSAAQVAEAYGKHSTIVER